MLSSERYAQLESIVRSASANALRSKRSRQNFAHHIASELQLNGNRVAQFIAEMDGLNFFVAEDRALFLEFAALGL